MDEKMIKVYVASSVLRPSHWPPATALRRFAAESGMGQEEEKEERGCGRDGGYRTPGARAPSLN